MIAWRWEILGKSNDMGDVLKLLAIQLKRSAGRGGELLTCDVCWIREVIL